MIDELEIMGVDTDALEPLSMEAIGTLLNGLRNLVAAHQHQHDRKRGRPRSTGEFVPILSSADKKIIHHLFSSEGHVTSLTLAKELDIPLSTIQRRRKRLESNLIERNYSLRVERLGYRAATLFISTSDGKTAAVGKEILDMDQMVTCVTKTLGENAMDLKADVIFKTNAELLSLIERIKATDGVRDISWSESIEVIGRSSKPYQLLIESQ